MKFGIGFTDMSGGAPPATPTLQLVTDAGNVTTNSVTIGASNAPNAILEVVSAGNSVPVIAATGSLSADFIFDVTEDIGGNGVLSLYDVSVNNQVKLDTIGLSWIDATGTTNISLGIGTNTPQRKLQVREDNNVTTVTYVGRFSHTRTSTSGFIDGMGVGIEFEQETSNGNNEIIATIEAVATTVTAGAEVGAIVVKTMAGGAAAAERLRIYDSIVLAPINTVFYWGSAGSSFITSNNTQYTVVSAVNQVALKPNVKITAGSSGTNVASAILEIESTSKGVLLPRMTTAQKAAISSPANHLILVDTNLNRIAYRSSSAAWWTLVIANENGAVGIGDNPGSGAFLTLGGATTSVASIVIGTTMSAPSAPADGAIWYENSNDRLMFHKNATSCEFITASAVTSEVVVSDTTLTITYNGTTYKLLAIA